MQVQRGGEHVGKSLVLLLLVLALGDLVELVLDSIDVAVLEPEDRASDEREDGHGGVVPEEARVLRERDERLTDGGGNRGREEEDGHDEGAHTLYSSDSAPS